MVVHCFVKEHVRLCSECWVVEVSCDVRRNWCRSVLTCSVFIIQLADINTSFLGQGLAAVVLYCIVEMLSEWLLSYEISLDMYKRLITRPCCCSALLYGGNAV